MRRVKKFANFGKFSIEVKLVLRCERMLGLYVSCFFTLLNVVPGFFCLLPGPSHDLGPFQR